MDMKAYQAFREDAVQEILNVRDFCGNETGAIEKVAKSHGVKLDDKTREVIFQEANRRWSKITQQARQSCLK